MAEITFLKSRGKYFQKLSIGWESSKYRRKIFTPDNFCNQQTFRTKAKIFKNGYQSSDEDGDDESETTKEKIKLSRERKNNFDVPEKVSSL